MLVIALVNEVLSVESLRTMPSLAVPVAEVGVVESFCALAVIPTNIDINIFISLITRRSQDF